MTKFWVGPLRRFPEPNGPWGVDYKDLADKRKRKTWGQKKKEGERGRRKLIRELEDGVHTPSSTKTFGDAFDAHEKRCQERHNFWLKAGKPVQRSKEWLAGGSLRNRRMVIANHIRPALSHVRLTDITTRDHLQPFINDLAVRTKTVQDEAFVAIKGALDQAVDNGWLTISPLALKKIDVPPRPDPKTSIPEIEEGRAIWCALQERALGDHRHVFLNRRAAAALAMFGGVEVGVSSELKWSDVDWINSQIHIKRSWSVFDGVKGPKNKFRIRSIPMSEEIRTSLAAIWERDGRPSDGYVFYTRPNRGGTRHSAYEGIRILCD